MFKTEEPVYFHGVGIYDYQHRKKKNQQHRQAANPVARIGVRTRHQPGIARGAADQARCPSRSRISPCRSPVSPSARPPTSATPAATGSANSPFTPAWIRPPASHPEPEKPADPKNPVIANVAAASNRLTNPANANSAKRPRKSS